MPGLFGGGGGTTQAPSTGGQPQPGTNQIYTPANQPGLDKSFQDLLTQLYNPAIGALQAYPGGVSPPQQGYATELPIAQAQAQPGTMPGSYGPYGDQALGKDQWGLSTLQDIYGTPQNLINYGQATGAAGLSALPLVQQAAFNPQIGQAVQNVIGNPYFNQALGGAQTGADIGGTTAAGIGQQIPQVTQLASGLPAIGQAAAGTTGAQIPLLQGLAGGSAATGANLSGMATGLLPQFGGIGGMGAGLAAAAPGIAQQAQTTDPITRAVQGSGLALGGAAPGFAQQAQGDVAPLRGVASDLLQTGFDPQSALFNQLTQQTRDQSNAINAMSGLAGTPYAAGLTSDALRNFDINWQNQQLQRQATAAGAASGVAGQQLAGTQEAGNLLSGLTTAGGGLALGGAAQQAANQQQMAQQLQNLTLGGGGLGLSALGGGLNALTGAGGLYNQGALGAGNLATTAGGLSTQQLNDILGAYQGAGGLYQTGLGLGQGAAGLAASSAGLPGDVFQRQQQAELQALQAQNQMAGLGVQNLGGLTSQLGAAGQQPITGITAAETLAAAPYNAAVTQAQNAINAVNQAVNVGNMSQQQAQQVLSNIQSYLQLGQSASTGAGQLGLQGQFANASQLQGIGSLLGGAGNLLGGGGGGGGSNLLFGSQGLSGALGLPSGGLLGSAFGPGTTLGGPAGGLFSTGGLFGSQGALFGTAADASIAAGGPPLALAALA